MEYLAT